MKLQAYDSLFHYSLLHQSRRPAAVPGFMQAHAPEGTAQVSRCYAACRNVPDIVFVRIYILPQILPCVKSVHIYSRCCVLDSDLNTEEKDWLWRDGYEVTNIDRVEKLRDLLSSLDYVDHRNQSCEIEEDYIGDPQKREEFKSNPQGYEFEFMLDYHYCRPRKN